MHLANTEHRHFLAGVAGPRTHVFLGGYLRGYSAMCVCAVVQGSIPYVPFLRAPYYIWIGQVPQLASIMAETKIEAPSGFPATFLYTMSWEDPRPDMEVTASPLTHPVAYSTEMGP